MANPSLLSLFLALLALSSGCLARQLSSQTPNECQLHQLNAIEPTNQVKSEAGLIEYWDPRSPQLQCAGVAMLRVTIQQNGLYLPTYSNGPIMAFVVQGQGATGAVFSGCPETYQASQEFGQGQYGQPGQYGQQGQRGQQGQQEQQGQRGQQGQQEQQGQQGQQSRGFRDMHQKIRRMRRGDALAFPAGVPHWYYNDGNSPLVLVAIIDVSNQINQLDRILRTFHLAGSNPQNPEQSLFAGFDTQILAQAFNIGHQTAQQLQNLGDNRGNIVNVPEKLRFLEPQQQAGQGGQYQVNENESNGLEETVCTLRIQENLDDPSRADIYNPQAGRISTLNSLNLPILRRLRLSAARGFLHRNAMVLPHWNLNAHSLMYVTGGRASVEVVNSRGQNVFKGEVRQGQLLTVPQGFAVVKRTHSDQGFEFIAFKTNDNAVISTLAGRLSSIVGLPIDVVRHGFGLSRDEAWQVKNNRQDSILAAINPKSQGRAEE